MMLGTEIKGSPLFERLGGFGSVSRIVTDFYDRVLDSDILAPWFENTDMRRLVDHQTKFVASLMGGPACYSASMIARAHARLGIDRAALDEMKRLLAATLEDHGVSPHDVGAVLDELESFAHLVVTA